MPIRFLSRSEKRLRSQLKEQVWLLLIIYAHLQRIVIRSRRVGARLNVPPTRHFFHSVMLNVALTEGESELGLRAVLHLVVELLTVGHVFVCLQ